MKSLIGGGDALGGGEVGVAQREPHLVRAGRAAKSISRSTMAPLAMRPTVGTPRVILAASPSAWKPPIATAPCADRVDLAVGAEQRRDQQRAALQALGVAQRRDGDVDPGALRAKAGRLAVTITAATLPVRNRLAAGVDAEPLQHRLQRCLVKGSCSACRRCRSGRPPGRSRPAGSGARPRHRRGP